MNRLNDLIDFLQEKFPPNRVVVLLTPVFAAGAAFLATWAAKHVPGVHLDKGQLTTVFVAGAAFVVPVVYKWLDGWQKHEATRALRPVEALSGALTPDERARLAAEIQRGAITAASIRSGTITAGDIAADGTIGEPPPPPEDPSVAERRKRGFWA